MHDRAGQRIFGRALVGALVAVCAACAPGPTGPPPRLVQPSAERKAELAEALRGPDATGEGPTTDADAGRAAEADGAGQAFLESDLHVRIAPEKLVLLACG